MTEGTDIIIVDDDTSMSQAIERLLSAVGLRSRSFATAEEFLSSGAAVHAALLIFDIQLPGISGLELQRRLAAEGSVAPVIFITGQDRAFTRDQACLSGVAYFVKPFAGAELIQAVRQHLVVA